MTPWAVDARLPGLTGAATGAELLVHRWGRRAVVRHETGFSKIVRSGQAAQLAERTARGADLAARVGFAAPAARPVGESRVALSTVSGHTLHHADGFDLEQWREIWSAWAATWPEFCAGRTTGPSRRTTGEEAATTAQWVRRAVAYGVLAPAYAALESALARLETQLRAGDPSANGAVPPRSARPADPRRAGRPDCDWSGYTRFVRAGAGWPTAGPGSGSRRPIRSVPGWTPQRH